MRLHHSEREGKTNAHLLCVAAEDDRVALARTPTDGSWHLSFDNGTRFRSFTGASPIYASRLYCS